MELKFERGSIEQLIYNKIISTYLYYRCKSCEEVVNRMKDNDWDVSLISNKDNFEFLLKVDNKNFKIITKDYPKPQILSITQIK